MVNGKNNKTHSLPFQLEAPHEKKELLNEYCDEMR
jgi:hypothetical protein